MYNFSALYLMTQRFALLFFIALFFSSSAFAQNITSAKYSAPLEATLHDYEQIAQKGGWGKISIGKTIKFGESDERIPKIRQILSIMGDYHQLINFSDNNILDANLTEAVKHFQTRHGLEPDGALGKKTQSALIVPIEYRIAQIKATLEKLRAIPELGERYILVNVAGFYLKAVENDKTMLTSRIIVGNLDNHTPLFQGEVTEVVFNPQWHVPARIAREEIVEKQRENSNYLKKSNFMVKTREGKNININDVNWDSEDAHSYKIIQRSGEGNALGKIKFNIPNIYGVYLHSTSTPKLFDKTVRAFSHGCVRVQMSRDLAYFVMNGREGWDKTKIDKFYDGDASKFIGIPPVPVYLTYFTSWVDEDSKQPHFQPDIYEIDGKRIAELLHNK